MGKALLAVALALAGCGGTTASDPPPVQRVGSLAGNWIDYELPCAIYLDATDTSFVLGRICTAADGVTVDMQATKGTYTMSGSKMLTANTDSSCVWMSRAYAETISFSGGNLVMSDSSGIVTFAPNAAPAGSGSATFGCFSNGTFTASPLAPL